MLKSDIRMAKTDSINSSNLAPNGVQSTYVGSLYPYTFDLSQRAKKFSIEYFESCSFDNASVS